MTGTAIALGLVAVLLAAATWSRRTERRALGSVLGVCAALPALVAVRDLPGPLIDGLLITTLLGVATVTMWPLLRGRGAGDRVGRRGGGS